MKRGGGCCTTPAGTGYKSSPLCAGRGCRPARCFPRPACRAHLRQCAPSRRRPQGHHSAFRRWERAFISICRAFVPSHFHNDWTVVAFAFVASTLLKGVCDYAGTYLANYAGFGMITDLRDDLYEAILRRSISFFQKHATGTLLSALINDIERVQYAMSSVLSDFLQQVFTLIFTAGVVIFLGGKLAWVLLLFVPIVIGSIRKIGRGVRQTTRKGQDKLAEIQNILHETITGNRIVKAFNMEFWELLRFRQAARRLFRANLRSVRAQAISSPLMDFIGAVAIALLLLFGRNAINSHAMTVGTFFAFIVALFKLYDPVRRSAVYYNSFQQATGRVTGHLRFHGRPGRSRRAEARLQPEGLSRCHPA